MSNIHASWGELEPELARLAAARERLAFVRFGAAGLWVAPLEPSQLRLELLERQQFQEPGFALRAQELLGAWDLVLVTLTEQLGTAAALPWVDVLGSVAFLLVQGGGYRAGRPLRAFPFDYRWPLAQGGVA